MDFADVKKLTNDLQDSITSGILEAPKWDLIRSAKLASRMYAPVGTLMSLGEYVRLTRKFLEVFKACYKGEVKDTTPGSIDPTLVRQLCDDLKVSSTTSIRPRSSGL